MRVIIAAAGGEDGKWGNHLGVPKQLAPVPVSAGGSTEPLLQRTIRQAVTLTEDVHVTIPAAPAGQDDHRAEWSQLTGAVRHVRRVSYPSEYASTRALWSDDDRTVLLLGDVYFTDAAIATIAGYGTRRYQAFGRSGASRLTGTPYGELFAASWWPEHHTRMDRHLELVHQLREQGTVTRPPGWMLLRAWQGTPLNRHLIKRRRFFTQIDDLTDDFDRPADYARHPATRQGELT